ncbi:MAG: carbonic anhydrase [Nocardioides sp.]|uniref:carbonic anhydrase n=1 Tax=Nocardioides sp. TaxID=35761 RepID=UPI003263675F
MQHLIDHARSFADRVAAHTTEFAQLADGPVTASVVRHLLRLPRHPLLITGAKPGELFELRTVGNIVPRHDEAHVAGEAATIEFAIEVLGVTDIVVCGHSHCGAVGAVVRGDDLSSAPTVRAWLDQAPPIADYGAPASPELADAVQVHVLNQLERLRVCPGIARQLRDGRLRLHGRYYEVHTGSVSAHRPHLDAFFRCEQAREPLAAN